MPAVTRLTAWKFVKGTTNEQKRQARGALLKLYSDLDRFVNHGPIGGKNISRFNLHKDLDLAFTVEFKSAQARDEFDGHPLHDTVVVTKLRPFIADIFVFDLVKDQYE
ncbi:unnamed protein product [Peniophora sp. CBMAI 1063]|nr:unnamed protein product [Peniophora sp. CBMAI 1063]